MLNDILFFIFFFEKRKKGNVKPMIAVIVNTW